MTTITIIAEEGASIRTARVELANAASHVAAGDSLAAEAAALLAVAAQLADPDCDGEVSAVTVDGETIAVRWA